MRARAHAALADTSLFRPARARRLSAQRSLEYELRQPVWRMITPEHAAEAEESMSRAVLQLRTAHKFCSVRAVVPE
jgi:Ser/Thr protein kinase RdoA (MazF antagonist)